jgi:anti-sigma factor RsiW
MIDRSQGDEIGRYLDGRMSEGERARFERRLSDDAALRRHLEAERSIRVVIEREVATMPTGHAATRAGMMSALAALPATPSAPVTRPPTASSPLLRWLGSLGAGAALVIGGYLATSRHDAALPPTRAVRPAAPAPTNSVGPAGGSSTAVAAPTDHPAVEDAQRARNARTPIEAPRSSDARRDNTNPGSARASAPAVAAEEPREIEPRVGKTPKKLRVVDRDSVKVRIGVEDVRREP